MCAGELLHCCDQPSAVRQQSKAGHKGSLHLKPSPPSPGAAEVWLLSSGAQELQPCALCGNGSAGTWWVTRLADELEHLTAANGNGCQEGAAVVPGTPAGPHWGHQDTWPPAHCGNARRLLPEEQSGSLGAGGAQAPGAGARQALHQEAAQPGACFGVNSSGLRSCLSRR